MFGHPPEECRRYDGLTTVRDAVLGRSDVSHAVWVASEAKRLFAAHQAGEPATLHDSVRLPSGEYIPSVCEADPAELILSGRYLDRHGFHKLGCAADRGRIVHLLLSEYNASEPLTPMACESRVRKILGAGDGDTPYRCTADDVIPYAQSLARWLAETGATVHASEIPGFADRHGYACTLDAILVFPNIREYYLVDLKTRSVSQRGDAIQLIAQDRCTWYGVPGTDSRKRRREFLPRRRNRVASLLVTPDSVRLRVIPEAEHPRIWRSWLRILATYRELINGNMPFTTIDTEKLTTKKTPQ
ncbi:MAG: hypothetical protein C4320_00460 [Armatimonadota bacterium]